MGKQTTQAEEVYLTITPVARKEKQLNFNISVRAIDPKKGQIVLISPN